MIRIRREHQVRKDRLVFDRRDALLVVRVDRAVTEVAVHAVEVLGTSNFDCVTGVRLAGKPRLRRVAANAVLAGAVRILVGDRARRVPDRITRRLPHHARDPCIPRLGIRLVAQVVAVTGHTGLRRQDRIELHRVRIRLRPRLEEIVECGWKLDLSATTFVTAAIIATTLTHCSDRAAQEPGDRRYRSQERVDERDDLTSPWKCQTYLFPSPFPWSPQLIRRATLTCCASDPITALTRPA